MVVVNDAMGNVTHHSFDSHNRLVRVQQFTGRANADRRSTPALNRPGDGLRSEDPDSFVTR